jgi:hypothetical protein
VIISVGSFILGLLATRTSVHWAGINPGPTVLQSSPVPEVHLVLPVNCYCLNVERALKVALFSVPDFGKHCRLFILFSFHIIVKLNGVSIEEL